MVKEYLFEEAIEVFSGSNVRITVGHEYLGGFLSSIPGQTEYVQKKVDNWIRLVRALANIAKSEPQAAYAAFVAGFCGRVTYFIRTIPNMSSMLLDLDLVITNELIPAITDGRSVSDEERELLALPVKLGGLGIPIFAECCKTEFRNSKLVCSQQVAAIVAQNNTDDLRSPPVEDHRRRIVREKYETQKSKLEQLRAGMSSEQLRANGIAQMKGSSS